MAWAFQGAVPFDSTCPCRPFLCCRCFFLESGNFFGEIHRFFRGDVFKKICLSKSDGNAKGLALKRLVVKVLWTPPKKKKLTFFGWNPSNSFGNAWIFLKWNFHEFSSRKLWGKYSNGPRVFVKKNQVRQLFEREDLEEQLQGDMEDNKKPLVV